MIVESKSSNLIYDSEHPKCALYEYGTTLTPIYIVSCYDPRTPDHAHLYFGASTSDESKEDAILRIMERGENGFKLQRKLNEICDYLTK